MILFCHEFIHLIILLDVSESDLFLIFLKVWNRSSSTAHGFGTEIWDEKLSFFLCISYYVLCIYVKCKKWFVDLDINQYKHIL